MRNVFILITICLSTVVSAQSELTTLEGLVREWVALETTISAEQQAHEQARRDLDLQERVLVAERDRLQAAIVEQEQGQAPITSRQVALAAREEKQAKILAAMVPHLAAAEADLAGWPKKIPPPLRPRLDAARDRLAAAKTTVERLQAILIAYEELARLDTVQALQWEKDGVMYDVVMLGLSNMWAVRVDDSTAATIRRVNEDWQWNWDATLAPAVRRAWKAHTEGSSASVPRLPIQVTP